MWTKLETKDVEALLADDPIGSDESDGGLEDSKEVVGFETEKVGTG
jgi:hypothetical protein